jgi:hypothetical protein
LDKSLHAQINYEVKKAVAANVFAATHQVVEPIFLKHFERDPERNLPVLANVNKDAQRTKGKSYPKNPLNMEFDLGKKILFVPLPK